MSNSISTASVAGPATRYERRGSAAWIRLRRPLLEVLAGAPTTARHGLTIPMVSRAGAERAGATPAIGRRRARRPASTPQPVEGGR